MKREIYREREDLISRTISMEDVERLPVLFNAPAFSARCSGITLEEFCTNREAAITATLDTMDKYRGFDGINMAITGRHTIGVTRYSLSRVRLPGRDLAPDGLWQVGDEEIMQPEDYDTIINKGWDYFWKGYQGKIIDPDQLTEEDEWSDKNTADSIKRYHVRGYVPLCSHIMTIPYESFSGGRSLQNFVFDLYRMPGKVLEAMDILLPVSIESAVKAARISGVKGVWIGGWRSASALTAPELWDRFVWPYIVRAVDTLLKEDLTPVFHWDQNWTRDLGRLRDLPAGRCVLNPDGMTDMKEFKRIAGNHMAVMGDTPCMLFAAGTPEDIRNYVRDLTRLFENRGLLLAPGCDAPVNTKPENMEAFMEAAETYGRLG